MFVTACRKQKKKKMEDWKKEEKGIGVHLRYIQITHVITAETETVT